MTTSPLIEEAEHVLSYREAIVEGIAEALRADDRAFLAGEDVGAYGSVFGITRGLIEEFGATRVRDTPISEAAMIGLGVGAAVAGTRPIIDIMFMDFLALAMDQLANQAAKLRFMSGGHATVPLTVITMAGAGMSMAAQHSQSLEAWFCHIPGLKVVAPSGPAEAKGLLLAAVDDDNPVLVIFNKLSLGARAAVTSAPMRLDESHIVRSGSDCTVIAIGRMVAEATKAADILANDGESVEVIDPRTLSPLDVSTIVESVRRTHHAVVVHEAVRFGGIGGEIAASIGESAFDWLDAPVERVAAPHAPVPFSPDLETEFVPDAGQIVAAIRRCRYRS